MKHMNHSVSVPFTETDDLPLQNQSDDEEAKGLPLVLNLIKMSKLPVIFFTFIEIHSFYVLIF